MHGVLGFWGRAPQIRRIRRHKKSGRHGFPVRIDKSSSLKLGMRVIA